MQGQNPQVYQNYKIYKTVLELLQARMYTIPEQRKDLTFEQFQAKDKQRGYEIQIFVLEDENNQGKQSSIAVFYNFKKEKITQDHITNMIKHVKQDVKNFFVITTITGKNNAPHIDKSALTMISELMHSSSSQDPIRIQLFKDQDLMFNILRHDLVPKHTLLSEAEKQQILIKYKVKQTQLPKILLHDPVAKFLGLRRGQVVKISRKSQTAGTYTTYRIALN